MPASVFVYRLLPIFHIGNYWLEPVYHAGTIIHFLYIPLTGETDYTLPYNTQSAAHPDILSPPCSGFRHTFFESLNNYRIKFFLPQPISVMQHLLEQSVHLLVPFQLRLILLAADQITAVMLGALLMFCSITVKCLVVEIQTFGFPRVSKLK